MAEYCPYCMRPATGAICPHCKKETAYAAQPYSLPVWTPLMGTDSVRTYLTGAVLGQGGFGITYIAREKHHDRRLAVKEYFPIHCAERLEGSPTVSAKNGMEAVYQNGLKSFLLEAKMLASQDDLPCVVRVVDYFPANNTAYLVMEYLDGVTLKQKVMEEGAIPARELLPKLPSLLDDLKKLHDANIIHRDISPDNLMWMPDGSLKLLDFGCARSMEDGKSMTVMLKHGFAPVEQYQSRGQGPWTDVYALCASIYYCLTGRVPPNAVERLEDDQIQPPIALGVQLTPEQETALMWGLTIQPRARPTNMGVLARRLFPVSPAPEAQTLPAPPETSPFQRLLDRVRKLFGRK